MERLTWHRPAGRKCTDYNAKPMTNADRIRAMSDEELGQVFGAWCDAGDCANCPELTGDFMRGKMFGVCPLSRKMHWSEWLQQPAEVIKQMKKAGYRVKEG